MSASLPKLLAVPGGRGCILVALALSLWAHCGPGAMAAESYGIQVAAYQDLKEATRRVDRLKRLGHRAFFRQETVQGKGKWYRVYIAEYPTREEAEKEARILRELELIDDYEVRPFGSEGRDEPERAGSGRYVLHVSSFKSRENAAKEAQSLKEAGHEAFFREQSISGETWYRVYLGGYATEEEARAAGRSLKRNGTISYFKPFLRKNE